MRHSTTALALVASAYALPSPSSPGTSLFLDMTTHFSRGGLAVCTSGSFEIQATITQNLDFNFNLPTNQSQVTEVLLEFISSGSSFVADVVRGTQTVSGTFTIAPTLCTPVDNPHPEQVQLLTHGVGFDRFYWDFAPGYSWVDIAAQYGRASFFYDRLGVGQSEKADALRLVQTPLEVEITHQIVRKLREGLFGAFKEVVGVGHSYGSQLTQAVTAQYPGDLDAAILTGWSVNTSAVPVFLMGQNFGLALPNAPYRFADIPTGYLVSSTLISNQIGFLKAPGFDPEIASLSEATKGTVTFGELFSQGAATVPAKKYTRPVAVVNGLHDLPSCLGNCSYPTNLAEAVLSALYPMTNKTGTYLARDAGHGLSLHYSAVEAYRWAQDFVGTNPE